MSSDVRKRRYRFSAHLPMPFSVKEAGIYAILNRANNKLYIGSSVRMNHRMTEHRTSLADGTHRNRYLKRAFEKSPDDFYVEVVEQTPNASTEQMLEREQFWINFFKSYLPENGYNISPTASSCKGVKHTPENIANMAHARSGPWSEEKKALWRERRNLNQPRGWKWTPEQCKRQSERRKGIKMPPLSLEHKKILADCHKKPVLQFSLEGYFLKRWECIQAAESVLGRGNITLACRGTVRHALGFVWKYACDAKETDIVPVRPRKPKGKHHVK